MDNNSTNQNNANVSVLQPFQIPNGFIKPLMLASTPTVAKGDIYYVDTNGIFARLPVGSANQLLTITSGLPSWQAAPSSLATSQIAYTETVDNTTFTNSYVTIAHTTITLVNNSNVFIIGTCDVRSTSGGDSVILNLFDGAGALTTNGVLTQVGSVSNARYMASVVYAGALTAGSHTINFEAKNNSSGSTITVGQIQLSSMAIPG